jgi:hypothetical protein
MHLAGTALAGIDDNRAGYGELDPDVLRVPTTWPTFARSAPAAAFWSCPTRW